MTTTAYDVELAVKILGNLCKENGIELSELRQHFPNRPTTEQECSAIAAWLSGAIRDKKEGRKELRGTEQAVSVNPPRPSTPQKADWSAIATRTDKNGKAQPSYFAVEMDGVLKFYRVKRGRKAGYFFVDAQASDDMYPVRSYSTVIEILNAIAKDPKAAMERYGQEIGSCGHCHRTLTGAESRAYGIGPVCRANDY